MQSYGGLRISSGGPPCERVDPKPSALGAEELIRARTRPRLPVVTTVEEVQAVLARLDGVEALRCHYGSMTLIFRVGRSLCAIARVLKIGARCCRRDSQRSCSVIWRRCAVYIAITWTPA